MPILLLTRSRRVSLTQEQYERLKSLAYTTTVNQTIIVGGQTFSRAEIIGIGDLPPEPARHLEPPEARWRTPLDKTPKPPHKTPESVKPLLKKLEDAGQDTSWYPGIDLPVDDKADN